MEQIWVGKFHNKWAGIQILENKDNLDTRLVLIKLQV